MRSGAQNRVTSGLRNNSSAANDEIDGVTTDFMAELTLVIMPEKNEIGAKTGRNAAAIIKPEQFRCGGGDGADGFVNSKSEFANSEGNRKRHRRTGRGTGVAIGCKNQFSARV